MHGRLRVLDIWVDPVTKEEALERVRSFVRSGNRPHTIFASNPEKNFSVPKDPLVYQIFEKADLLIPDGVGIVCAARLLYGARLQRIPGADFMLDICELAAKEGYRIFMYGAKEEVNRRSAEKLKERYPSLVIAGRAHGYVKDSDMPSLIRTINDSKADILFLALGSPKQEKWFAAYKKELTTIKVVQGIGGTLDTIAGTVKRAPKVWQQMNLEWLYRLIEEPKRIKRQKLLPLFAALVIMQKGKAMVTRS